MAERDLVQRQVERTLVEVVERLVNQTTSNDRIIILLESLHQFIMESSLSESFSEIISLIREAVECLEDASHQEKRGRKEIPLRLSAIEELLRMNFRITEISRLYGVSRKTLYRRMKAAGMSAKMSYSEISDDELDSKVVEVLLEFPNTGYKRMQGFLLSRNIKLTQYRIREVMRRVDPEGVYYRTQQNRAINRRQYFVRFSNYLWHIDTNLKLRRWSIVIRGGLDGKSRTCVYLNAGSSNCAESNLQAFLIGIEEYGIPYRCRSDKGGENRLVAEFMLQSRGIGRSSHICGKSVHNQRIERFWRDLGYGFIRFYKDVFSHMENENILDPENPFHILALHITFLPRINQALKLFRWAWNCHPISTEGNKTPEQLMLLHLPPGNTDMIMSQEETESSFLVNEVPDLDRFDSTGIHNFTVHYPEIPQRVRHEIDGINVLRDSENYGIDIYNEILRSLNA